ncbi:uncharacterized protein LOC130760808 [Actinidia eriantha]|uniref:uncharacterized protein LOC130760808 n=1 Tax=Actinidia eriantha TaxID=165200 RepID=UPI0025878E3D|nr:uncharacterized protein LOC130760808 [Actinidia eriantha]
MDQEVVDTIKIMAKFNSFASPWRLYRVFSSGTGVQTIASIIHLLYQLDDLGKKVKLLERPKQRCANTGFQAIMCVVRSVSTCICGFVAMGSRWWKKLEGHNKAATGIALPSGSDKLYTGCK